MSEPRLPDHVEWPTIAVGAGVWGGWAAMLIFHRHLPAIAVVAGFAIVIAWYMSLQHEVIHGHPTPWRSVNEALVAAPLTLWLPYSVYRDSHRLHHEVELTMPGVDPESFYVTPQQWATAGPVRRSLLAVNRTFIGRLLIGPSIGPPSLVLSELRLARHNALLTRMWLTHLLGAAAVLWVVVGVAGVPWWQYALGASYVAMSLTYVRSFVEHRGVDGDVTRSSVVRGGRFFSLLFLNNNLHHTHHAMAGVAWYRLPQLTDAMGAEEFAASGAGAYPSYWSIMRRFAFRPFCQPVNPLLDETHVW